jgi:hypothetical protein
MYILLTLPLVTCLSFVRPADAQNGTSAPSHEQQIRVAWQAGPTERGTLALVYGCIVTIFACTWTVLHLNVPCHKNGSVKVGLRKAKWMAITILFPEFISSKAICDLRLALSDLRDFDAQLRDKYNDNLRWTIKSNDGNHILEHTWKWRVSYGAHVNLTKLLYGLLRLPGPLAARENAGTTAAASQENRRERKIQRYDTVQEWTTTHAYLANMGGILYPKADRYTT